MTRNQSARKSLRRGNTKLACSLVTIFAMAFLFSFAGTSVRAAAGRSGMQDASASTPKLSGHWQLNKDQSDDVRQKMQAARGDSGGDRGGGDVAERGRDCDARGNAVEHQ